MSKIRVGIFVAAMFALAAAAFAQQPPSMSAQQPQPNMPGQQVQPAQPSRPAMPSQPDKTQPDKTQNAPANTASPADTIARRLAEALSLSDTQTTQVRSALEDERTKLLALRDDAAMSPEAKQTKLMEIRRGASDKIMSILTPEQQKKLVDLVQRQQQEHMQQSPQPAAPPQTPTTPPR